MTPRIATIAETVRAKIGEDPAVIAACALTMADWLKARGFATEDALPLVCELVDGLELNVRRGHPVMVAVAHHPSQRRACAIYIANADGYARLDAWTAEQHAQGAALLGINPENVRAALSAAADLEALRRVH